MTSSFDRWEKDPFFAAAEEVQESADRMETIYRTWIHAKKDSSGMWNSGELQRDLRTALGTTKWQLEEFEKAVGSSYVANSADDAKGRHHDFVIAMENQISTIENSLRESTILEGKPPLPWVRLDEGERDELALFLSGSTSSSEEKSVSKNTIGDEATSILKDEDKVSPTGCSKNSSNSSERALLDTMNGKSMHGHRRIVSAADIGTWKISISGDLSLNSSSSGQPEMPPPRRIPSFSGLLSTMESASKLKWSKNGFRKLKAIDHAQEADILLLQTPQLTKGINVCYEKSKSCLESCDECYDKQLYSWYGALQRQLQRSQYQMQYSRPIRVICCVALLLCFIILIALRAT